MNIESKKRRLMELVDLSVEPWRKAAFYSNDEAMELLTQLYQRWELNERRGNPLDHATDEELDRLLAVAERIEPEDMRDQQSKMLIAALYGEEVLESVKAQERKRRRGIIRILKKMFFLE
ncbi:MAG: hypothetical protein RMH84_01980 [Sulfolobales archaeon]|nr:hypothetical protein [Sulfolobales archaeon]MCX8208076.1 hypothetical protein [Sulfolobales archaeon]MDW8010346.1 hypothetical protein [Sulfolobales archaeon]